MPGLFAWATISDSLPMQPNALAFIALCNEFCSALEQLATGGPQAITDRKDFVASMLNYIPRLYIAATDLKSPEAVDYTIGDNDDVVDSGFYDMSADWAIDNLLEEEYYESVRRAIGGVMGQDDVFLEVFEEDMKYSETPISASVSEGLADIFQSLYNFIETVRDAPSERIFSALAAAKDDFEHYWSRIACNILRALNNTRYFSTSTDE